VGLALCLGLGIAIATAEIGDWYLSDLNVYLGAAERIRAGATPYVMASGDTTFRYAPWFAYAFVPFTFLPLQVVRVLWSGILVAASVAAVLPLLRRGSAGLALGVLGGGVLVGVAGSGNVQPLIIAALVHGIDRRSGPVWIALVASLKLVPLGFAGYYLARREWWRLAMSVVLTAVLLAPMLLYERPSTVYTPGESLALYASSPEAWFVAAGIAAAVALIACWRRSRYAGAWLAASVLFALPRLFVYDISFAIPGATERSPRTPAES
jgi:hypothetical protein